MTVQKLDGESIRRVRFHPRFKNAGLLSSRTFLLMGVLFAIFSVAVIRYKVNPTENMQFNCRLKEIIQHRRITVRELSQETGLSTNTINRLCNQEMARIDKGSTQTLCDFLEVTFDELWEIRE